MVLPVSKVSNDQPIRSIEECRVEHAGESLEALLLRVSAQDRENQWIRKVNYFDSRGLSQDEQLKTNQEAVNSFLSKSDLGWAAASVTLSIVGAFAGQSIVGGVFQGLAMATQAAGKHHESTLQADRTYHNFTGDRKKGITGALEQELQGSDRRYEDSFKSDERISDLMHRQATAAA